MRLEMLWAESKNGATPSDGCCMNTSAASTRTSSRKKKKKTQPEPSRRPVNSAFKLLLRHQIQEVQ